MKDQQPESEASMEEILSSIRQIISADAGDEKKPASTTASSAPTAQPATRGPDAPAKPSTSAAPSQPAAKDSSSIGDGKGDDVLVLTEAVEKDGRVVSLDTAKNAAPDPTDEKSKSGSAAPTPAAPVGASSPTPAKAETKPMADVKPLESKPTEELVSSDAAKATSRSLNQLADTIAEHQAAKDVVPEMPLGTGSTKSLEDIVRELMRPMLKDWLDENLPGVVERVVRKEVQKLVRQVDD